MGRWQTVAPVLPEYHDREGVFLQQFPLGSGVSIAPLASFALPEEIAQQTAFRDLAEIRHQQFAFVAEYEAAFFGEPDSTGTSKQLQAERLIRLAMLSFWIVRPTGMGFKVVFTAEVDESGRHGRGWKTFMPTLVPLASYQRAKVESGDLQFARELFSVLVTLPSEGTLWVAETMTLKALREYDGANRFILLWIALEALFGPSDGREMTHRLSHRLAFFLGETPEEAKAIFREGKEGYRWRSKIVHGFHVSGMTAERSLALTSFAEDVVRRSMNKILRDARLQAAFESDSEREKYLDEMAFSAPWSA